MTKATKITCTRCNGSGNFSFNLTRGTVCFGCNGAGFMMVDAVKHTKAQAAKAARQAKADATMARRQELARQFSAEIDALYGPFADNEKGAYDRMCAAKRNTGKTIGEMVSEALAKEM
jgi:Ni,Fe-hydrogenase I small subunit